MANSRLGVYWSVMHRRQQDYDYFKRLQPSVFKIMDGGPPDYQFAKDNLPNSLVIARDWALSEQHSDMLKDPVGTGKRHAQEWSNHQSRLGFDRARTLILGINEPRVWETGVPEALRQYTIAMCDEATRLGLRVGAMQFSVGWPNNKGPDTPPDWSLWHGVDNAIRRNNGALVCHEYWADAGPFENWGWWGGRVLKCPWQVPIVVGETGVDMYVKDGSVPHASRGWQGRMEPERYARELAEYVFKMSADSRFVGCAVFAADFASHEWFSFDIERAYAAILSTTIPQPATTGSTPEKPDTSLPPPIMQPPVTFFVSVKLGANVRTQPLTGSIVTAIPFGEQVSVTGYDAVRQWAYVRWQGIEGYVLAALLSSREPSAPSAPTVVGDGPTPVQPPPGDNWQRCLAFILRWEGGWADDPNDVGGATMRGITIGTYTRWREAHGQPAPSKDDLRNIPDAIVEQIFREWYWNESKANTLAWPMCLAQMNIAVNAGPGRALQFLADSGGNFLLYNAIALEWYTKIDGWKHFSAAWARRCADVLREAAGK